MAHSGDINNIFVKTEFLNLRVISDATSDFVIEHLFRLKYFKTIGRTNIKLGTTNYDSEVSVIRGLTTSS